MLRCYKYCSSHEPRLLLRWTNQSNFLTLQLQSGSSVSKFSLVMQQLNFKLCDQIFVTPIAAWESLLFQLFFPFFYLWLFIKENIFLLYLHHGDCCVHPPNLNLQFSFIFQFSTFILLLLYIHKATGCVQTVSSSWNIVGSRGHDFAGNQSLFAPTFPSTLYAIVLPLKIRFALSPLHLPVSSHLSDKNYRTFTSKIAYIHMHIIYAPSFILSDGNPFVLQRNTVPQADSFSKNNKLFAFPFNKISIQVRLPTTGNKDYSVVTISHDWPKVFLNHTVTDASLTPSTPPRPALTVWIAASLPPCPDAVTPHCDLQLNWVSPP